MSSLLNRTLQIKKSMPFPYTPPRYHNVFVWAHYSHTAFRFYYPQRVELACGKALPKALLYISCVGGMSSLLPTNRTTNCWAKRLLGPYHLALDSPPTLFAVASLHPLSYCQFVQVDSTVSRIGQIRLPSPYRQSCPSLRKDASSTDFTNINGASDR